MNEEQLYCGCCGNEIGRSTRSDPLWCNRCARHVARSYRGYTRLAPWDQTYEARTGKPCPFQVTIFDLAPCLDCNSTGAVPAGGGEDPADIIDGYVPCPTCNQGWAL